MKTRKTAAGLFLALLFFISASFISPGETTTRKYNIIYKGKIIGSLNLLQQKRKQFTYINIRTSASVKKIITFAVSSQDDAMFENGVLMWSKVYREVNGKAHEDKKTTLSNFRYELINGQHKTTLTERITGNMINLYMREPVNETRVYSDSHLRFVDLLKTGIHTYKIALPDGNINIYEYENNMCKKLTIQTRFYDFHFELAE
jgi:hypothetical protein